MEGENIYLDDDDEMTRILLMRVEIHDSIQKASKFDWKIVNIVISTIPTQQHSQVVKEMDEGSTEEILPSCQIISNKIQLNVKDFGDDLKVWRDLKELRLEISLMKEPNSTSMRMNTFCIPFQMAF